MRLPGEGTLFRTPAPSALPPRAFNVLQPRPDHTYTDELMSQYNVSSCFSAPSDQAVLQDIFLSPRGLLDQEDSSIASSPRFKHLSVCGSCHHSLLTVKTDNPPALSIANDLHAKRPHRPEIWMNPQSKYSINFFKQQPSYLDPWQCVAVIGNRYVPTL